jgi:hypothetical protein
VGIILNFVDFYVFWNGASSSRRGGPDYCWSLSLYRGVILLVPSLSVSLCLSLPPLTSNQLDLDLPWTRVSEKSLLPALPLLLAYFPCVSVCVCPLSLLGIGLISTFPRQRIHTQQQKNYWTPSFSMWPVSYRRKLYLFLRETKEKSKIWIKAQQHCYSWGILFILVP